MASFTQATFVAADETTEIIDGRDKIAALLIIPSANNTSFQIAVQASLDTPNVNDRQWVTSDTYNQNDDKGYQIVMSDPFIYRIKCDEITDGNVKVVFG